MRKKKKNSDVDYDTVISDMSGIEKPNLFMPHMPERYSRLKKAEKSGENQLRYDPNFDYSQADQIDKEATKWYILGALKASLLIAGVFLAGLGLVIALMLIFWR